MPAPTVLDKAHWPPQYVSVWAWRQKQLMLLKDDPTLMYGCVEYYRKRPVEFICHWVDTFDPRNALIDLPTHLPFVLFQRQADMVDFVMECLEAEECGLIDKSRDMGVTWLACAISVYLWRYYPGASIGWGSRKQDLVDKLGDPDSIFEKMRMIIYRLPKFFWPRGFEPQNHMTFMKIVNPENDATITGEAGDQIGRGGRKLMYWKDESAHYEHAESVEAALGDNTRVQMDISTTSGVGSIFDRKRESGYIWTPGSTPPPGTTRVLVMDWSDHPAKNQEWYDTRLAKAKQEGLLAVFRQEVDRDPAAAVQGIICPQEWVRAALDAHKKLKLEEVGRCVAGFDVADEGGDLNALAIRKGVVLNYADDWGEDDTGKNTRRVAYVARDRAPCDVQYDCNGVGAGVKAESNRLVSEKIMPRNIQFVPWSAGAKVLNPEERVIRGDNGSPLNKDFYGNLKAQGWWSLRRRFETTYRALNEKGFKYDPADLISLDSRIPKIRQLMRELSQPVMKHDGALRLIVDKKPEGTKSPNMADAVMMCYFPLAGKLMISDKAMEWASGAQIAPEPADQEDTPRMTPKKPNWWKP